MSNPILLRTRYVRQQNGLKIRIDQQRHTLKDGSTQVLWSIKELGYSHSDFNACKSFAINQ